MMRTCNRAQLALGHVAALVLAAATAGLSCAGAEDGVASNVTPGAGGKDGGTAGSPAQEAGPDSASAGQAGAGGEHDGGAESGPEPEEAGPQDSGAEEASGCQSPACAQGQTQTEPCGVCNSGVRARACVDGCLWGSWGSCQGEGSYPVHPSSAAPVCPPYAKAAVFFAPHPDDEVLAMGGAIAEHVASGRPVFVEMLTHGTASGVLGALNNGQSCSWHSGSHVYNLTAQEFGESRVREFKQAASLLGVKGVYVSELGDGQLQNKKPQIQERIQWWIAQVGTGLSLKGIATLSAQDHADHRALWSTLLASGWGDIRGYAYSAGTAEGTSSTANAVALGTYCAPKVDSFKAYKTWNPGAGRYAVGYHSVSSFFDTIGAECKEYRVAP